MKRHLSSFKSNTIKIKTKGWVPNSFHMHVDGRIGLLQSKNYTQKRSSRYLFSIVPSAIESASTSATIQSPPSDPDVRDPHGTTVYPIWQPLKGFTNTDSFHKYMASVYPERGLSLSFPRPLYELPERLCYRSKVSGAASHKRSGFGGLSWCTDCVTLRLVGRLGRCSFTTLTSATERKGVK